MTVSSGSDNSPKNDKYDRYLGARISHHLREVTGVASIGFTVVFFYGFLTLIKDDTGKNANTMLEEFIEHAIKSINFGLLTFAILALGISLIFYGSKAADSLQRYVVQPILNFVQHGCALTLGVALGYVALAGIGLQSHQEFGGASAFIALAFFVIGLLVTGRSVFEVLGKELADRFCAEIIVKVYSKFYSPIDSSHPVVARGQFAILFSVGVLLSSTAVVQIPMDLKNAVRPVNHAGSVQCTTETGGKK